MYDFEPVSGGRDLEHADETGRWLVVSDSDGAVEFQATEHALNAVAVLIERPVMLDLYAAV